MSKIIIEVDTHTQTILNVYVAIEEKDIKI